MGQDRVKGYVWRLKTQLPERFGQSCAIVGCNASSVLIMVEFEDRVQVRAPRTTMRRVYPVQT